MRPLRPGRSRIAWAAVLLGVTGGGGLAAASNLGRLQDPSGLDRDAELRSYSRKLMASAGLPELPREALRRREELCARTELAFVGTVSRVLTLRTPLPSRIRFESDVSFTPERFVVGRQAGLVEVRVPAGWDGPRWVGLNYYPAFVRGERYAVALWEARDGSLKILGDGKAAVALDPQFPLPPESVLRHVWLDHCEATTAAESPGATAESGSPWALRPGVR